MLFQTLIQFLFFENLGVPCKLKRGGRYFIASDKAQDAVDALVKEVKNFPKYLLLLTSKV
ncbi:MAG: hypothetical protein LBS15_00020 [Endomicrobium sp.]|jgi:predicted flavoprotein YhiN|nr:hypothetical protein [Endomicrobium sp.]